MVYLFGLTNHITNVSGLIQLNVELELVLELDLELMLCLVQNFT